VEAATNKVVVETRVDIVDAVNNIQNRQGRQVRNLSQRQFV
jgi:hypothetical protein